MINWKASVPNSYASGGVVDADLSIVPTSLLARRKGKARGRRSNVFTFMYSYRFRRT